MKRLPLLMFAVAGCFAVTSCSDDDSAGNNTSADLVGSYELTSYTAPNEQDFDGDGDSNTNLVMEGSCYNDSWISFHSDGTYDEGFTSTTMGDGGLSVECETQISSGTYTQEGNSVTTTRTSGSGSLNATYTFNSSSRTLSRTQNGSSYTGFNSVTHLWTELTGNVNLVFTKYSDNEDDNGDSQDDDNNTSTSGRAEIVGGFDLTSLLTASAQDLDDDGDSSSNLTTETTCYGNSNITFNSDGTYEEESSTTVLGNAGTSLTCNTETTTGTWIRNGDAVFTRSSGNVTTEYSLDASSNTISRTDANGQYPTFNSVTSLFAMLTGNLEYEYSKN